MNTINNQMGQRVIIGNKTFISSGIHIPGTDDEHKQGAYKRSDGK